MTGQPRLIGQERSVLWSREWLSELVFCSIYSPLFFLSFSPFPIIYILIPDEYKATGSGSSGTNTGGINNVGRTGWGGATGMCAVIFCSCFSMFIFSSFHSSTFPIITFPTSTSTGKAGRDGKRPTQATTTMRGGAGGGQARPGSMSSVFVLLFSFSSYHSSSFTIVSFSVERGNRSEGRGVPTQAAMVTRGRTGGRQAQRMHILSLLFFLLSSFLLLTFVISFSAYY